MARATYTKLVHLSPAEKAVLEESVENGLAKNETVAIRHAIGLLRTQLEAERRASAPNTC